MAKAISESDRRGKVGVKARLSERRGLAGHQNRPVFLLSVPNADLPVPSLKFIRSRMPSQVRRHRPGTVVGGPVAGVARTPCAHKPRCRKIRSMTARSSINAVIRISCEHRGYRSGSVRTPS